MSLHAFSHALHAATPAVSLGDRHALALTQDGAMRAWGNGGLGQLGDGTPVRYPAAMAVSGLPGMRAVSAGTHHTVAIANDGSLWAWGNNSYGSIGDGSLANQLRPVRLAAPTDVVAVAAGVFHTVALKRDGSVWAWGANFLGDLGDGTFDHRSTPVQVAGLTGISAISVADGGSFGLALGSDGGVWAWGHNSNGQLGDGTRSSRPTPQRVAGLAGIIAIAAGREHALALASDGRVWAWGGNFSGQLGDGMFNDRSTPQPVSGLSGVTAIAAGAAHSLALRNDGSVWTWGQNFSGALGDGTFQNRSTPAAVSGLSNVAAVAGGGYHSFALLRDGTLSAWGFNGWGQLGNLAETIVRATPAAVPGVSGVTEISTGHYHSAAIRSDGSVLTWGSDGFGQLGRGVSASRTTPVAIATLSDVAAISAGNRHSVAARSDGTVWAWGLNEEGQLGDGVGIPRAVPTQVPGISGITMVSAAGLHTLARRNDGTVWAWGYNGYGALAGASPNVLQFSAVQVPGIGGVTAVAAGFAHSLALRTDGSVWAWGDNSQGQIGDGSNLTRRSPVQVPGLSDVTAIAAGDLYSLALQRNGTVWAWGSNIDGELGDGTYTRRPRPVQVSGLDGIVAIAAGASHALALKGDGSVWAWGYNAYGQLGDGTSVNRTLAVRVVALNTPASIAAGGFQSAAVMADGSVRSWGWNTDGQLGDGTLVDRFTHVVTLREQGAGSIAGNDWLLDLDATRPNQISAADTPVFKALASGDVSVALSAQIQYRAQDAGGTGSVFVFAMAPASVVRAAPGGQPPFAVGKATSKGAKADVQCVLAQLTASGQLQAVSAQALQAFLTGVLSSQGQAVTILSGVPTINIGGATFFVGYGSNASGMLTSGTNRAVATIPGSVQCRPEPPQTGWWWNPAEDGRGYSIERRGNNLFFAAFLYDVSGRSTWHVASGPASLDGSLYMGDLLSAHGGQTLGGAYPGFPTLSNAGPIALAFNTASSGTLVWPGGAVPIQRFNIVPDGLTMAPAANQPESGWWWNEQEAGRGFFMEWQGGTLDIAGYMYDDQGNPVWYLTVGGMSADGRTFTGNWWSYGNGMTLAGPWRPHTRTNDNVAPLTITFSGPDSAVMTLPNNRTTNLRRHRF